MANTINDLYLKYVNKVGRTLENDRYFQYLFEMVQAGSNTLQQTHQILQFQALYPLLFPQSLRFVHPILFLPL